MVKSVTCILSFDFTDHTPNKLIRCLRIHLGDIISPRCFLTVTDISARLSLSSAICIQDTLGWFTFEPLKGPVALFGCIFANVRKLWFIETFWYCRSLKQCPSRWKYTKTRDHQHLQWQVGADECCRDAGIDPNLPSSASIFEPFKRRRSIILQQDAKAVISTRVGTTFPGEVEKKDGQQRVRSMEVKVKLAE